MVHLAVFKPAYHNAKMTALGKKIFKKGAYRLTAADLLKVAKKAWEDAFSTDNCLKAWHVIGVSPFTQNVYWELKEKDVKTAVVARREIDPELLTVKGMVKIMYNGVALAVPQKRDCDTLNSSDLWDLPGGATADDCYDRVKNKMDVRLTKAATALANKEASKAKGAATTSSLITYGSMIVPLLADGSHAHRQAEGAPANGRACLQGSRGPKGLHESRLAEARQRCPQAAHEQGAYSLACSACPTYMQLYLGRWAAGPELRCYAR